MKRINPGFFIAIGLLLATIVLVDIAYQRGYNNGRSSQVVTTTVISAPQPSVLSPTVISVQQPSALTPARPILYREVSTPLNFRDSPPGEVPCLGKLVQEIKDKTVAILKGSCINEQMHGVYMAVRGPARVDVTVGDGAILVVSEDESSTEWCRQLNQAKIQKWPVAKIDPLPEWPACLF